MEIYPFTLQAMGKGRVGAAILVMDLSDDSPPRGMYAVFGDDEWTEDLDTVVAMQHLQYPGVSAVPTRALDGDLPELPEELQGLDLTS